MAIGAIAYPGFTDAHVISNREAFHRNMEAVEVITTKGTNKIDINDSIPPTEVHRNVHGQPVRYVYKGRTVWYFLMRTSAKPWVISIENTAGGNITELVVMQSITGYAWDNTSYLGSNAEVELLNGSTIAPNTSYFLVPTQGVLYPDGVFMMIKITCSTDTEVSVQTI